MRVFEVGKQRSTLGFVVMQMQQREMGIVYYFCCCRRESGSIFSQGTMQVITRETVHCSCAFCFLKFLILIFGLGSWEEWEDVEKILGLFDKILFFILDKKIISFIIHNGCYN